MIQIREREAAAAHDRDVVQRQEQERRLESELKLKAVINEEKEQKSKDAEEYRKFLLGQVPPILTPFWLISLPLTQPWHATNMNAGKTYVQVPDVKE